METKKRTQATDIAEIATKLDGKVKFSSIIYSQQMLSEKYRETGVNDMYFIGKKFGLWFYTSRAALDSLCYLQNPKLKTADDLSDDLCLYCPLDDGEKGTHGVPNGYISCEGRCCQEAYEMYIEEWTE